MCNFGSAELATKKQAVKRRERINVLQIVRMNAQKILTFYQENIVKVNA